MSRCQQLSRQRLKVCIIMWDFICVCVMHWYVSETTKSIVYGPVSSEIRDWPNTWCLCHYACAQIIIISTSCILGFGVQMYMFCTEGYLCNAVHFIIFAARGHLQWKNLKIRVTSCISQTSHILLVTGYPGHLLCTVNVCSLVFDCLARWKACWRFIVQSLVVEALYAFTCW